MNCEGGEDGEDGEIESERGRESIVFLPVSPTCGIHRRNGEIAHRGQDSRMDARVPDPKNL